MRAARLLVTSACALCALAAVVVAWLEDSPSLSEADARAVAIAALDGAGVRDVAVDAAVRQGTFARDGEPAVAVWQVIAAIPGGRAEIWMQQADATIVRLDDTAGSANLLTLAQVQALIGGHSYPALDRRVHRNLAGTAAGAAVTLTAIALATTNVGGLRGEKRP